MRRVRSRHTALNLPSLRLEGALFLPDQLEKAALGQAHNQMESDYGIPRGLKLKDEYSRAFQIAVAQWRQFENQLDRLDLDPAVVTQQFVVELLRDALGYSHLARISGLTASDRRYPVTALAGAVPVVIAPHNLELDDPDSRFAVEGGGSRRKSAFQLAQECLNAHPECLWALVSNGRQIRLLRDAATLTRPSYLEIDLQDVLDGQRYAEFAMAWRLLHASRSPQATLLSDTRVSRENECVWELWREAGSEEGTRVREGLREGVTEALVTLGEGFLTHPANEALRQELLDGTLTTDAFFQQILRLVYRLIFIFNIEERGLLHPQDDSTEAIRARRAYAEGYAFGKLRDYCIKRRARNRHDDRWQAARIVFTGLAHGESRLGLPALGGLFAANHCPDLDRASLDNAHWLAAFKALRWSQRDGGLVPVDYRNMGTEELGSVYESLLELVPEIDLTARRFGFVGLTSEGSTAGNARKLTGSYYTPDALVQELIHSALDPVIEQRLREQPDHPIEALLGIRVMDPACGSGHFLLAAARRLAERLAQLRAPEGAVKPQDYRHALREVIGRCIYGVDRNPMAIELARIALWLEGYEEGRPLGFLDHHLQSGDALLGVMDLQSLQAGIPKEAFKPLSGDGKDLCKHLSKSNSLALKDLEKKRKSHALGQLEMDVTECGSGELQAIEALPENSTQEIAAKESAYLRFIEQAKTSRLAHAADLLVGAYLLPKTQLPSPLDGEGLGMRGDIPTSATLYLTLLGDTLSSDQQGALAAAQAVCREARVLHWPLAFPQVFANGGFDCVLGNPPWERIKLQEEEFFATRHRDVAEAKNKAERSQRIQWLAEGMLAKHLHFSAHPELVEGPECVAEQRLYAEFINARRTAEAASVFMHVKGEDGGRYPLTGVGDVNTYALFAETIQQITHATGRAGFIVPTGIATDDSTKAFFGHITQNGRLISLFDIENREAVFPAVHRSYKFCLLTLGAAPGANFVCFATQVSQLADPRRRFSLTPDEFRLINPNTLTCPVFRSERDAELTKKLYRAAPVLIEEGKDNGNPWGISFMRQLDMANDSHLFLDQPTAHSLPLYEAKMIHQFDHRWATYLPSPGGRGSGGEGEGSRDVTVEEKNDPNFTVTPRYWVSAREVWLRTARLPGGLLKALKDGNQQAIVLCVTQLLFGWWLSNQRRRQPSIGVYPAWQEFVENHPYAAEIAPTSLGLVGNNPASLQPQSDDYLPAEGELKVERYHPGSRHATAWYMADPSAVQTVIDYTSRYLNLPQSPEPLTDADVVEALAEQWLQAASPQWLLGWRDICRATDERTVIASVMPRAGVNHKTPLFFAQRAPTVGHCAALLGNFNAVVLDYVARQKVGGTSLTYFYLKQLPLLSPDRYIAADLAFIVPRVLELTYTAHDLKPWAEDLGYDGAPFPFNPDRRAHLRAELDAYYARLYGLTRDELRYILDPADIMGEDYPSETFRVLKKNEIREFGEYRTQRLVLAAWDEFETGELH